MGSFHVLENSLHRMQLKSGHQYVCYPSRRRQFRDINGDWTIIEDFTFVWWLKLLWFHYQILVGRRNKDGSLKRKWPRV